MTTEDLKKFGLIPEFIGRMARPVAFERLSTEMLVKVLTESRNSVTRKYNSAFADRSIKLTFEEGALLAVAEKGYKMETGARSLNSILTKVLDDIFYEILMSPMSVMECIITEDVINNGAPPVIIGRNNVKNENFVYAIR
jgi:ATP-dependent Clp protease ATP-binding subunit ClpX